MTIDNLKCFLILAEELNFSRAAERVHTGQSTMTRKIMAIEEELGITLFVRDRHSVTLTPAGQIFAAKVRPVIADYDLAVSAARGETESLDSSITIGVGLYEHLLLNPVMPAFLKQNPIRKVNLEQFPYLSLLDRFLNNQLDIILTTDQYFPDFPMDDVRTVLLNAEPWLLAISKSHPLAEKKSVTREMVNNLNLITMLEGPIRVVKRSLLRQGISPVSVDYVNSLETKLLLIEAGRGGGLFPSFIDLSAYPGITVLPFDPPDHYRKFYALYKESNRNPMTFRLAEHLKLWYSAGT